MGLVTQISKNSRVDFVSDDGEMRPGRQGIAFKAELLPEMIDALKQAEGA